MSNDEYQWDTVEAYRLNKDIIDGFLQRTFGYYDYFTEVRLFLNKGSIFEEKIANHVYS
jgi:hypothetical protein